jgi:hypothetical protein
MNCLRSLECWDRGFESHSRNGYLYCVYLFCVCVVLCVGRGLSTGWSPVQGVLQTVYMIKKLKNQPWFTKRTVEPWTITWLRKPWMINAIKYFDVLNFPADSAVGIATGYGIDDWGFVVRVPIGSRIFFSPRHPDRLWGPPNLLSNG